MNTYRIQYKYWLGYTGHLNGLRHYKCRSYRTYEAESVDKAIELFHLDKTQRMISPNSEIIKIWQLVNGTNKERPS